MIDATSICTYNKVKLSQPNELADMNIVIELFLFINVIGNRNKILIQQRNLCTVEQNNYLEIIKTAKFHVND